MAELVRFDCLGGCNQAWFSPPDVGCPRCGPGHPAMADPRTWEISKIQNYNIYLSAHLRDEQRFDQIRAKGVSIVVDMAMDFDGKYVWRPQPGQYSAHGVHHVLIEACHDNNVHLPPHAFDQTYQAIQMGLASRQGVLVHCAAGLKRSPHVLYGCFRKMGRSPGEAWALIEGARPFVSPFEPYIDCAERWVAGELETAYSHT